MRELYPSANELRSKWTKTEERQHIVNALSERGISFEHLAEVTGNFDADPFDLLMQEIEGKKIMAKNEFEKAIKKPVF